jgi:hypothetical protein
VCLSFEEEMVISLSKKKVARLLILGYETLNNFFFASALFFSFVPFSLFCLQNWYLQKE